MHFMSLLRMLSGTMVIHLYPTPCERHTFVQAAGVPIPVMWQLGRDTSHVPACLEYSRGGRLEMHYKKIGYNINVLQQTACLVVNPITVGNFVFLFNCTLVGRTSDSMMVPT